MDSAWASTEEALTEAAASSLSEFKPQVVDSVVVVVEVRGRGGVAVRGFVVEYC